MKGSLTNLPQQKRARLVRIVSIIRESAPQAEMIILLGSYTWGDTLRRLAPNHAPAFFRTFPLRTKQERDRFDLLRQPYIGAHYHDDYKITPQGTKILGKARRTAPATDKSQLRKEDGVVYEKNIKPQRTWRGLWPQPKS